MGRLDARDAGKAGFDPRLVLQIVLFLTLLWIVAGIWTAQKISSLLTGSPSQDQLQIGFFETVAETIKGTIPFTPTAIGIFVASTIILAILGGGIGLKQKKKKKKIKVDKAATWLATNDEIDTLSRKEAEAKAKRWLTGLPEDQRHEYPGLRIGKIPNSKRYLFSTWEDLFLVIFGPRMGKTTTQVIPAIVDAPGVVLTTSNKRDIVDDTIKITQTRGTVFVFDPQGIAPDCGSIKWFFDPLDMVRENENTMDSAAIELADIFRCASQGENNKGDSFFTEGGRDILAAFFLAAALDHRPISDCFLWASNDTDRTPVKILQQHPEWEIQAKNLAAKYSITEKTRSGLFSNAAQIAAPLGRREAVKWVTPQNDALRFNAAEFVRSHIHQHGDTLYLLSKDGADNAAALTTALTAAVMKAAEKYGEQNGGRLPVPLIAALDEAANTVKWPQLPRLYSHYGSRSIILMTILQSYAQGVAVWGEEGMEALWSAASVMIYGGGVRDEQMLQKMEALIGEHEEWTRTVSWNQGVRSTTASKRERKILNVSELSALGNNRAIVFSTKRRPIIAQLIPFWERSDWKENIKNNLPKKQ